MGKASRWFRGLLGLKKSTDQPPPPPPPSTVTHTDLKPSKEKRKWSFGKSYREKDHRHQNHSTRPTTTATSISTAAGDNRRGGQYGDASVPPSVSSSGYADGGVDQNKHAIAVAAATAAVAEAAVAAAQAAAAVVRLTSSGRCNSSSTAYVSSSCSVVGVRDEWAALKIQSAFRGYLAKRALRALKGLVKLQALVRGHIVRKRTEDTWRRMQVLLRAQARACAGRAIVSESPLSSSKSSHYYYTGPATPEKFEHVVRARSTRHNQPSTLKRNGSKSNSRVFNDKSHLSWNCSDQQIDEGLWDQHGSTRTGLIDDEKSDKILEIDTGKPHFIPKRRNLLHSSHHHALDSDQNSHSFTTSKDSTTRQTVPSQSSCEVQSLSPLKFSHEVEEGPYCTAENSPQFYSASSRGGSSRRGPFTPTNSDGSRSYLSGYSDHPNYMAYTQSSKAKLRSLSAPKQRPHFDRSSSAKRYSVHGFGDLRSSSHKAASTLHTNFTSKAYPGSGRLDRLGMPVRGGDLIGSAGGFYNKC